MTPACPISTFSNVLVYFKSMENASGICFPLLQAGTKATCPHLPTGVSFPDPHFQMPHLDLLTHSQLQLLNRSDRLTYFTTFTPTIFKHFKLFSV